MIEREVKAKVDDPEAVIERIERAGAVRLFRGMMHDRRLDRGDQLTARGETLRIRTYQSDQIRTVVGWKGPVTVEDGAKVRPEIEIDASGDAAGLFAALGYLPCHAIDRRIEVFQLAGATVRLEWYPRMDVLIEVEGSIAGIEAAIAVLGLPRGDFSADPLVEFVTRYEAAGGKAALSLGELGAEPPGWGSR